MQIKQLNQSNWNGVTSNRILENRLTCLNTKFQERKRKLLTFTNVKNAKAQIIYILMNKKWINWALNWEAYSSFEGVSSDHNTVTAKIRLNIGRNTTQTTKTTDYDWSLLNNRDISNHHHHQVVSRARISLTLSRHFSLVGCCRQDLFKIARSILV